MRVLETDIELHQNFRRRSVYLIAFVIGLSLLAITGWEFNVDWIKHPLPHLIAMHPISAMSFLAAGISFLLLSPGEERTAHTLVGYMLSSLVVLIGFLRISELLTGADFHLNSLLFDRQFHAELTLGLARPITLNGAVNNIMVGSAIILSHIGTPLSKKTANFLALVVFVMAMFAAIGYIYVVKDYMGLLTYIPMAIHTAVGFMLVALALIFTNAGAGWMKIIFSTNAGGINARVLLPAAVLIPILLGFIRLQIDYVYPVSVQLGVSFLITGIILLMFVLILLTSNAINRKDLLQKSAEAALLETNAALENKIIERTEDLSRNEKFFRALIEHSSDAVVLTDPDLNVSFQSPGAERMTGISLDRRKSNPGLSYAHPDDKQAIQAAVTNSLSKPGVPIPFQSRFLHLKGHYIWIEGVITNLLHEKSVNAIAFNYREVTERKDLEEQQSLFVSLVNLSNDAIISKRMDGTILSWNLGAVTIFGYTAEEAIGRNISMIVPTESMGEEWGIMEKIKRGISITNFETVRKKKDGTMVSISLTVSPIKDAQGNIVGASKIARDVSVQKESERKIVANEQRFRALVENDFSITSLWNEHFESVYRSPSVTLILGWSDQELKEHPLETLMHPDEVEYQRSIIKQAVKNPGMPVPMTVRIKHRDGHYVWLQGIMVNKIADPNIKGIISNLHDITAQKEAIEKLTSSELRFRALIENISDGIVLNDEFSEVLYQSPSVARILGYTMEERLGTHVRNKVHPDNQEDFINLYKKIKENPGVPFSFQYQFQHKLGHYIWLEGVVTNMLHDPNVAAYVANYRDITGRKISEHEIIQLNSELEEKVNSRTKQLEVVNKELEAFTYSVSHDLRAPLRIINGFCEILREDNAESLDAKGQKTLDTIVKNAIKMTQLIDDLLEFSKVGRTALRMNKVNMNDLVQEVIHELEASGIAIPAHLVVMPLGFSQGDGSLLKQVWTNLVSNAIKYSSGRPDPQIEIGVTPEAASDVYYVKDNGAGFDMAYSHKLFNVFQRLHRQEEFAGTGVGLALAQRIINRHGGRIWATAAVDKGATFYFSLPTVSNVVP